MEKRILTHDNLVDLFSTALYGCTFLGVDTETLNESFKTLNCPTSPDDCIEDKMAKVLLNGGKVGIIDFEAEGEVYTSSLPISTKKMRNGDVIYYLSLQDIIDGCYETLDAIKLSAELFDDEEGDYITANDLLQLILFGEVIYG